MNATTLFVLPDGTVQGLYTDAIELRSLGPLRVQRASSIEFDHPAQVWRVFDAHGTCIHSAPSRQECLRFEHAFFTDRENLTRSLA